MNRYHLLHVTEFVYDGPVSESYNEVRLRPMHDDNQSCLSFRLSTVPASPTFSYRDALGNWVHQVNILPVHERLRVQAESVVLTHDATATTSFMQLGEIEQRQEELQDEFYDMLAASKYVPHLPALSSLIAEAEARCDGTVAGFARRASDLIHERFQYVKGATHVNSSISDSLQLGAGVCQDFAHVLLGVLRKRGIPARYVSGYLVPQNKDNPAAKPEEVIGGQASHAWAEAYIPDSDWMPLDATLGTSPWVCATFASRTAATTRTWLRFVVSRKVTPDNDSQSTSAYAQRSTTRATKPSPSQPPFRRNRSPSSRARNRAGSSRAYFSTTETRRHCNYVN